MVLSRDMCAHPGPKLRNRAAAKKRLGRFFMPSPLFLPAKKERLEHLCQGKESSPRSPRADPSRGAQAEDCGRLLQAPKTLSQSTRRPQTQVKAGFKQRALLRQKLRGEAAPGGHPSPLAEEVAPTAERGLDRLATEQHLLLKLDVLASSRPERSPGPQDCLEPLASRWPEGHEVHKLCGNGELFAVRVGVPLRIRKDNGPLFLPDKLLESPGPPEHRPPVPGRAGPRPSELELPIHHGLEGPEHSREPFRIALEVAQRQGNSLHRGQALFGGLTADPVVARAFGPKGDPGKPLEGGIQGEQLLRKLPGPVDHNQRVQIALPKLSDVGRRRAGKEECGPPLGNEGALEADVQLGVGEGKVSHSRRADRDPPLPRVLKKDHAGPRRKARHLGAEAHPRGAPAA